MIQQFISRQFFVFLLTGGIAAGFNFGSRIIYNQWFDFSTSVILAFITGLIAGFVLMKLFVFRGSNQSVQRSSFLYVMVNLFALLQTWAISIGLAYYLLPFGGIKAYVNEVAHAIGVAIPVITSYIGHKRWSFR